MNAKEIAERTLALAKDATPGEWLHNELYGVVQTHSDDVPLATVAREGNVPLPHYTLAYIAHASPQNMQTLANAYLDSVEREKKLLDAFEQWSSEIRPLTHKLGEALQALDEHQEGSGE